MTTGVLLFFGMSFLSGGYISYRLTKAYYLRKRRKEGAAADAKI